jgi:hypothetical protein
MTVVTKTTAECLNDYLAQAGESGIRLIASFTGAVDTTVRDWRGKKLPGGIYLLGLRYFLEHQGFTPSDLADMPAYARNFGRLIAFRVITEDQALEAIGYLNRNQLQAVLLRGAGCTSVREQAMQKVARECADELEKQKQYFAQHGKFPKPELKSLAELYGVNISFDWLGEPSGELIASGTIVECYEHLATDGKATEDHLKKLTAWIGVVWHPTGRDWFLGRQFPKGMLLIKLAYYLEQVGFGIEELMALDAETRLFGRMMAFGLLDLNCALDTLGYSRRNGEAVLGVILRGKTMMPGSHGLLSEYAKSHKEKLAEALEQFRSNTAIPPLKPPEPEVVKPLPPPAVGVEVSALLQAPVAPPLEPISATQSLDPNDLVAIAAHQMGALIPLLEALAMNPEFSKEHRVRLRELVNAYGSGGVFHLYQLVEALTSESSRKKLT